LSLRWLATCLTLTIACCGSQQTLAETISVLNTASLAAPGQSSAIVSFNAGATADKIVVLLSSELSGLTSTVITYNNEPLSLIPATTAGRNRGIWYLDNPYNGGAASLSITITAGAINGLGAGILSMSGSIAGYAATRIASNSLSTTLTTTAESSLIVAGLAGNYSTGTTASADAPLTQIYGNVDIGSAAAAAGYSQPVAAGSHTYSFSFNGFEPSSNVVSAASFTAVPEPSTVIGLIAAVPFGLRLLRKRRRTASPDTDADTGILKS